MAIPAIATPAVVIPGAVVVTASVQLSAAITTAQTVLTNTAALNVLPSHIVLRSPSVNTTPATVTVVCNGSTVATLAGVALPANSGAVIIPLNQAATSGRVLTPGATLTVTFSAASPAGTVIDCDVLGYVVIY